MQTENVCMKTLYAQRKEHIITPQRAQLEHVWWGSHRVRCLLVMFKIACHLQCDFFIIPLFSKTHITAFCCIHIILEKCSVYINIYAHKYLCNMRLFHIIWPLHYLHGLYIGQCVGECRWLVEFSVINHENTMSMNPQDSRLKTQDLRLRTRDLLPPLSKK